MNQNPLYEIEKIDIPLNEEIHTFDAHGYVKNSTKSSLLILTNTNNREQLLLEKTRHLTADDSLISGWTNGNLYIYTPAEETIDILRIDDSIRVITKSNTPTFSISKEPGLGYGIGAQWIRISIFGLSVAATNTFRWTWDSS